MEDYDETPPGVRTKKDKTMNNLTLLIFGSILYAIALVTGSMFFGFFGLLFMTYGSIIAIKEGYGIDE